MLSLSSLFAILFYLLYSMLNLIKRGVTVHIFPNGAIFSDSKSDIEIKCDVLVADIFELNMDMKAMLMVELCGDTNFSDKQMQEHIQSISKCDTFECSALAMANVFNCTFRDCEIEVDYYNGNIARVYIKVDDIDHQECRPIRNNYDQMIEMLSIEDI